MRVNIGIVGAPVDLGADRRGVDMGASAIRYAGLEAALRAAGHTVRDFGNVPVEIAESTESGGHALKYLGPIVGMADRLADCVSDILVSECLPLILGGDHSVSLGSVAGVARHKRIGIIWMDAHGDYNTGDTSPSGNIHGMVLSALAGHGHPKLVNIGGISPKVDPRNVVLVGVRELDDGERSLLRATGAHVLSMNSVDRRGMARAMEEAIERAGAGADGIHLSLDLDVVDPFQAPGVGTPVYGGLTYRETHFAMELVAESQRLLSMDVVEVNPVLDNHNETARLAMEFILSALGKRII
ncbi:MAG TPA: arginase [Chloroflexota bacterium]